MVSLFTATARVTVRNSHAISRATYAKRRALLFIAVRIAARGKKKEGRETSSKIHSDFQRLFCRAREVSRFAIIMARIWQGCMFEIKKFASKRMQCFCTGGALKGFMYVDWTKGVTSRLKNLLSRTPYGSTHPFALNSQNVVQQLLLFSGIVRR